MMLYKNVSRSTKTFYGVTFKPGEIKEVPQEINHTYLIKVNSVPKEPPKSAGKKCDDVTSVQKQTKVIKEDKVDGTDSDK